MTEKHTDNSPAELEPEEARSATPVKGMTTVLGVSIVAVVIVFFIAIAFIA